MVHARIPVGILLFILSVSPGALFGWLVRKDNETAPGRVEYHSRDGAVAGNDGNRAPLLLMKTRSVEE